MVVVANLPVPDAPILAVLVVLLPHDCGMDPILIYSVTTATTSRMINTRIIHNHVLFYLFLIIVPFSLLLCGSNGSDRHYYKYIMNKNKPCISIITTNHTSYMIEPRPGAGWLGDREGGSVMGRRRRRRIDR